MAKIYLLVLGEDNEILQIICTLKSWFDHTAKYRTEFILITFHALDK